ncbi:hypothetical protein AB0L65_32955 [Nonomuraea sp. NPDC052116]|uniref:hypothetical protein n=1 Tax=Nonomuraea sp. NPDC052116 TaxID=3155665 RepID=UPI00341EF365
MPAYFEASNELEALMGPDETQTDCCQPGDACGIHNPRTAAEIADRLIEDARQRHARERALADRFGWR